MKIVVIGTRGIPDIQGGIETLCQELYPRIAAMGYDVTVINRKPYLPKTVKFYKGVQLINLYAPKSKRFETIVHTFLAVLKARSMNPNILHVHAVGPALVVPLARLLGMKVVFTHHGPDYDRSKWGLVARTMLKLGERMACRYADEVIVISDEIRRLLSRKYGRTRNVHLIYNGVPKPDVCDYSEYFTELGIEKGKYVLGVCRFVPEKRLHDLIAAFALLRENGRLPAGLRLVLAGDTNFEDDYSRSLKQQARDAGVVLTGFIKGRKLHSLLTHASCYVQPSSHEGLSISLLEAMSYRLPVVVSDIPANLEVGLADDCYFHMGNVEQLTAHIGGIVNGDLRRMDYDMKKYDWDNIACQVCRVYNNT